MKSVKSNERSHEEVEQEGCCSKQNWMFKLFYFFFIASYSCKCVFVPLFFKQLGLPAHYVGLLTGVAPFSAGAGAPILGYIADKTNSRKSILLFGLAVQTITPLICLIPRPKRYLCAADQGNYTIEQGLVSDYDVDPDPKINSNTVRWVVHSPDARRIIHSSVTQNNTILDYYMNITNGTERSLPSWYSRYDNDDAVENNTLPLDYHMNITDGTESALPNWYSRYASDDAIHLDGIVEESEAWDIFVFLFFTLLVGEFLGGAVHNIADSATVYILGENRSEYGKIFMFGNIGTVIAALLVTMMAHLLRFEVCDELQEDFQFAMYVISISTLFSFFVGLKLAIPKRDDRQEQLTHPETKGSLDQFVFTFRNLTFLIVVFYLGIGIGTFYAFMFWYLTEINDGPVALVIAIIMVLRNIALGGAFALSGCVIRKLGSVNIINCSLVLMTAVFTSYAFLEDAWWAIIPDVLHSLSFGLGWAASVTFCAERAPVDLVATVQGLVEGLYKGIGYGLGPVISGFLINHLGGPPTFLLFGGTSMVMLGFSFLAQLISRALERRRSDKELGYYPLPPQDDDAGWPGDAGQVHNQKQENGNHQYAHPSSQARSGKEPGNEDAVCTDKLRP